MRRAVAVVAVAIATLVATAVPAFAHEEINPSTIQTGKPTFFTLTAANEKSTDLTKLVLTAPAGTSLGDSTRSPAGWTASRAAQAITWTGGKVAPGTFDQFGFEIDGADQPGTLTFKVSLTAGTDTEASVPVTVVAGTGTSGAPTTSSPTVTAAPTTSAPTTTAPTSGTSDAAVATATKKAADASDKSSTATTLAAIAIGLAVIAIVLGVTALARRRTTANAAPTDPPARPASTPQDF